MRRPITLNHLPAKASAQKGFALFIVLMIMIVIALLVVTATQSYNTEQRISINDADHKFATTLAEAALRQGENDIYSIEEGRQIFNDQCSKGLCRAKQLSIKEYTTPTGIIDVKGEADLSKVEEAWKRKNAKCLDSYSKKETECINVNGREYPIDKNSGAKKPPRYIIEYLSTNSTDNRTIYRVTAKAWGKNENTVVMLQSYVANE